MQYGTMVDLLPEAQRAGVREARLLRAEIAGAFACWLSSQELEGITVTQDEKDALRLAFEKGVGNYYTHST